MAADEPLTRPLARSHTMGSFARITTAVVAAGLLAAGCTGDDDPAPSASENPRTRVGATAAVEGEPTGWNPHSTDRSDALLAVSQLLLPSAFHVEANGEVVLNEDLLVSAEVVGTDPHVVEYRIRPDAVWSDGVPVTDDDFAYLWRMHVDPDAEVRDRSGYDQIDSIDGLGPSAATGDEAEGDDPKVLRVEFDEPMGEWRRLFDMLLPAHVYVDAQGWNGALDGPSAPTVTAGPYRVGELITGDRITLIADERHVGTAPGIEQIAVRFNIQPADLPAALENGEVDVVEADAQLDLADQIGRLAPDVAVHIGFGYAWEHLEFNLRHPDLANVAVRRAIALALDRREVVARTVRHLDNRAERLDHRIFVNHQVEYVPQAGEYAEPDRAGAEATLAAAGYAKGADGVWARDGRRLSLRLSTTGGDALREDVQTVIAEQLAAVGIEVVSANDAGAAVLARFFPPSGTLADQDYDVAMFAWDATPFPHRNRRLYETDGRRVSFNPSGYSNRTVLGLFDRAAGELDHTAVTELYHEIDRLLWAEMPSIPLYARPRLLGQRSTIEGVEFHPLRGPLASAPRWTVREG